MIPPRPLLFTILALVAFAANSWLCRFALRSGAIDPASFTALRLASGACLLWPLAKALEPRAARRGSWGSALALFGYALGFSLAYVSLPTGSGALLLFAAVQATMIGGGILAGERPTSRQWTGLLLAAAGLVVLVAPGLTAPSPIGCAFMAAAGAAWGIYSLRGRGGSDPVTVTAGNFLRASLPAGLVLGAAALGAGSVHVTPKGALLAAISGAVTSGVGYVLWYAALRELAATTAAIVQLSVPALAALGGVVFLAEQLTPTLVVSGLAILGGVALAVTGRSKRGR